MKKLLRANHTPYVKVLREAIMRRLYIEQLYLKNKTPCSLKNIRKKIYCSKLHKKECRAYFDKTSC